ncbi:MAG: hypothetical protein KatS3mg081_0123 [Gemmatimonadales bacterium]|nr:MAG: hypothetical protein KatS3mg081_0123 [Gemmatimonadales bacterium]
MLSGELRDESFAARLARVVDRDPDPAYRVYTDPEIFFARTYPTAGLRTLLAETLGRLTGNNPGAAPVIRLETGFGGGKTHNLIACYHAASGKTGSALLERFVGADQVPMAPARIAAVVGEDLDPVSGIRHSDGLTTRTLWGEIAYQLGGRDGFGLVEANDREGVPPSTRTWQQLIGDAPVLILLDELAPYLRSLRQSRSLQRMADQLAPFLKGLLEAVASAPRAVCVLTLAEASDAFGRETEEIGQALTVLLGELRSISARVERTLSPTAGEDEIGSILVHRLFEQVDEKAAREAAASYRDYFERLRAQGADLPATALQGEYANLIERSYPFHPELLITLNRKTSTIPNFQRTRGALRLLARAVRRVWQTRPADATLFHLHHLDLSDGEIADDLTGRLDRPRYKQVIEADIASGVPEAPAHAEAIDLEWRKARRPAVAVKAATAVFLHSLTQQAAAGARTEEVNLAVLSPGDDPVLLEQALKALERIAYHLEYEGERWRFQPEPSLNKMIADEANYVGVSQAKRILDERIRGIWQSGTFDVVRFPSEPSSVPDDAGRPKLVIVHYDAAQAQEEDEFPPDLVRRLYQEAGTSGGHRVFQNNVLFLVADGGQVDRMVQAARFWKAVERLASDPGRQAGFTAEQRRRLRERRDESELALRVAIHRCYRFLYLPSGDAPQKAAGLAREVLPAQEQGEVQQDQSRVLLEALKRLEKVYTADSPPIDPLFLKSRAWTAGRPAVGVRDLVRAFAMRRGLKMLLDGRPLREGILKGIQAGKWIYYDPAQGVGYGTVSPSPAIALDSDAELIEPEEARARGIPIKGDAIKPERCPVCGNPADACTCAPPPGPRPPTSELSGAGTVDQALQQVADAMHDHGVDALKLLRIKVQGSDGEGKRELRSVGLAVPQLGAVTCWLEVHATAEFGGGESFRIDFRGPWERYRRLKDALEGLLKEANRLETTAALECRFGEPGCDAVRLGEIRDVLRPLDLGHVEVQAQAVGRDV